MVLSPIDISIVVEQVDEYWISPTFVSYAVASTRGSSFRSLMGRSEQRLTLNA